MITSAPPAAASSSGGQGRREGGKEGGKEGEKYGGRQGGKQKAGRHGPTGQADCCSHCPLLPPPPSSRSVKGSACVNP
eukprot:3327839-Pyramimonas_sp.AAC.1